MSSNEIAVAYDAYMAQVDHNLETAGPSDDLVAVLSAEEEIDLAAVMIAVRQMVADACGKAKMLWTGSPVGTIIRNKINGQSAQRAINSAGIPLWKVSDNAGGTWDRHEPVLEPEADWTCIYNPETEE